MAGSEEHADAIQILEHLQKGSLAALAAKYQMHFAPVLAPPIHRLVQNLHALKAAKEVFLSFLASM